MIPERTLDYALLDAGAGERLDAFGGVVVARPAPAAEGARRAPARWSEASARFEPRGGWTISAPPPEPWIAHAHGLALHLQPTGSGQVGWFPEKTALVDELASLLERAAKDPGRGGPPRVLHLFAYTGAATLACARTLPWRPSCMPWLLPGPPLRCFTWPGSEGRKTG